MDEEDLASRGERLKAAIIDGLLFVLPYALIKADVDLPLSALGAALILALTAAQFWLLATRGQSIGKRLLHIRIVRLQDGDNGGFFTNVIKRTIVSGLLNLVPFYWLADTLMIFRGDRRCAHDFIAGTRVVKGEPNTAA